MARTVLRVKRRKDDPKPPSTFKLQPQTASRKRSRNGDDEETKSLTSMMDKSAFLSTHVTTEGGSAGAGAGSSIGINLPAPAKKRDIAEPQEESKPIVFRRVETHTERHSHKRKLHSEDHVKVVDVMLDLNVDVDDMSTASKKGRQEAEGKRDTKRPRISLQMVESRIMLEKEFWQQHVGKESKKQKGPRSLKEVNRDTPSLSSVSSGKSDLRARMRRTASGVSTASSQNISSRKTSNRILDPLSKLIDDSLRSVHTDTNAQNSTESILRHIKLLQEHLQSMAFPKLVNFACTDGSGTILHLCALSNSVQGAQTLCRLFSHAMDFSCRDDHAKSAIMIARSVGASNVVEVIEAYWNEKQEDIEDNEEDFVYDVYCLDDSHQNGDDASTKTNYPLPPHPRHNGSNTSRNGEILAADKLAEGTPALTTDTPHNSFNVESSYAASAASATSHVTVENMSEDGSVPAIVTMRGGFGYWKDGELILDVQLDTDMDNSDFEDEEYDSNREDCDANDYPDDHNDSDENGYYNSFIDRGTGLAPPRFSGEVDGHQYLDSDDDEFDTNVINFRNQPVDLGNLKIGGNAHGFVETPNDADDADDGEYRGFMFTDSARWSNERIYNETEAFDPEMDADASD